jgi:hypothetical protein
MRDAESARRRSVAGSSPARRTSIGALSAGPCSSCRTITVASGASRASGACSAAWSAGVPRMSVVFTTSCPKFATLNSGSTL